MISKLLVCALFVLLVNCSADNIIKTISLKSDYMYRFLKAEMYFGEQMFAESYDEYKYLSENINDIKIDERLLETAILLKVEGKHELALTKVLRHDSENVKLNKYYLLSLVNQDKVELARDHIKFMIDLLVKKIPYNLYEANKFIAVILNMSTNKDAAESLLHDRYLADNEENSLISLAWYYSLNKKHLKASSLLNDFKKSKTVSDYIPMLEADMLISQGKKLEAIAVLKSANKDSIDINQILVALLYESKDYPAAEIIYKKLMKIDPDNQETWSFSLISMYLVDEKTLMAESLLLKLSKKESSSQRAFFALGLIKESQDDIPAAISYYKKINTEDFILSAKLRLADLVSIKDKNAGLKILDELDVDDIGDYRKVLKSKAMLYFNAKDWAKAYDVFSEIIEFYPDSDVYYQRALTAEYMGNIKQMELDLLYLINLDETDYESLNALGYSLVVHTKRYKEALGYIKRALKISPDSYHILDSMGWVLFKTGDLKGAEHYLNKAMLIKEDAEVAAHLVELLVKKGDYNQALKYYNKVLSIDENNKSIAMLKEILNLKDD